MGTNFGGLRHGEKNLFKKRSEAEKEIENGTDRVLFLKIFGSIIK